MSDLKLTSKTILLNYMVEVDLEYFYTEAECNVIIYLNSSNKPCVCVEDWDFNYFDFLGITHNKDVHVKWNELTDFLGNNGVPLNELVQDEIDNYFTDEIKTRILNESKF